MSQMFLKSCVLLDVIIYTKGKYKRMKICLFCHFEKEGSFFCLSLAKWTLRSLCFEGCLFECQVLNQIMLSYGPWLSALAGSVKNIKLVVYLKFCTTYLRCSTLDSYKNNNLKNSAYRQIIILKIPIITAPVINSYWNSLWEQICS